MADEHKLRAEWFWTDRWFSSSACCLPIDARGLYRELLTRAWSMGAKLPTDPGMLMRLAGVTADEWDRCWPLVQPYWREIDGHLVNLTQLEIYADCQKRQSVRTERAQKAAQARWGQCSSNAKAMLVVCPPEPSLSLSQSKEQEQEPTPLKEASATSSPRSTAVDPNGYPGDFITFWNAYPRKVGKGTALKAWKKQKAHRQFDAILAALEWQVRSDQWTRDAAFVPHPTTWLNRRGWEDEPGTTIQTRPDLPDRTRRNYEAARRFMERTELKEASDEGK